MADGPDESNLKVSCNMAQAFEIPTGNQIVTRLEEFPDTLSRSPLPAGPTPPTGSMAGIWVRLRLAASAHLLVRCGWRQALFRLGDLTEVNQSCRI